MQQLYTHYVPAGCLSMMLQSDVEATLANKCSRGKLLPGSVIQTDGKLFIFGKYA
jgi:hypothetical protein